jgi:hypothetical protein
MSTEYAVTNYPDSEAKNVTVEITGLECKLDMFTKAESVKEKPVEKEK